MVTEIGCTYPLEAIPYSLNNGLLLECPLHSRSIFLLSYRHLISTIGLVACSQHLTICSEGMYIYLTLLGTLGKVEEVIYIYLCRFNDAEIISFRIILQHLTFSTLTTHHIENRILHIGCQGYGQVAIVVMCSQQSIVVLLQGCCCAFKFVLIIRAICQRYRIILRFSHIEELLFSNSTV